MPNRTGVGTNGGVENSSKLNKRGEWEGGSKIENSIAEMGWRKFYFYRIKIEYKEAKVYKVAITLYK